MFYDNLVKFLKELNVEGASSIARDAPSISFESDGVLITITDAPPGMEISATLGELLPEGIEEAFSKLLRGNLLGVTTKKPCLGLDETGKKVSITSSIPTVRSYREFRDAIEDFVNSVAFWKTELAQNFTPIAAT
jgi:hypothetical protein